MSNNEVKSVYATSEQLARYGMEHYEVLVTKQEAKCILTRKKGGKFVMVYVDPKGETKPVRFKNIEEARAVMIASICMGLPLFTKPEV
jgi:hypothetical protein